MAGCSQGPILWACGVRERLAEHKENKKMTEWRGKHWRRPEGEQQVVPGSRANIEYGEQAVCCSRPSRKTPTHSLLQTNA